MNTISAIRSCARGLGPSNTFVCGRSEEYDTIRSFISRSYEAGSSGVLFLSGSPGTGKTFCLNEAVKEVVGMTDTSSVLPSSKARGKRAQARNPMDRILLLNGVGTNDCAKLLGALCPFIGISAREEREVKQIMARNGFGAAMEHLLQKRKDEPNCAPRIVIIDEIDQLFQDSEPSHPAALPPSVATRRRTRAGRSGDNGSTSSPLSDFVRLFLEPEAKLTLCAIANTVSLERVFAHTAKSSGHSSRFESVPFKPYSFEQLKDIVWQRMQSGLDQLHSTGPQSAEMLKVNQFVEEGAVEFCIRKICASHGDCRRALDATRRILEAKLDDIGEKDPSDILEAGVGRNTATPTSLPSTDVSESGGGDSAVGASPKILTAEVEAVNVKDVYMLFSDQMRGEHQKKVSLIASLPQHQQLVLCAACLLKEEVSAREAEMSDTTVSAGAIQVKYSELCKHRSIQPLYTGVTIRTGLEGLQNCGLIAWEDSAQRGQRSRPVGGRGRSTKLRATARTEAGVDVSNHRASLSALGRVNAFFSGVCESEGVA